MWLVPFESGRTRKPRPSRLGRPQLRSSPSCARFRCLLGLPSLSTRATPPPSSCRGRRSRPRGPPLSVPPRRHRTAPRPPNRLRFSLAPLVAMLLPRTTLSRRLMPRGLTAPSGRRSPITRSHREGVGWGGSGAVAMLSWWTERARTAREARRRKHRRPEAEERSESQPTSRPRAFWCRSQ